MDERRFSICLYHFTDVSNAISILKNKKIYSRNKAVDLKLMQLDNASSEIIEGSHGHVKDYVRFYFRPKTPTQYRNEGIMSQKEQEDSTFKAHCPVPVFFLFRSWEVLSREDVFFTKESLALHKEVSLFQGIDQYQALPFENIFHNRTLFNYQPEEKKQIIENRHAEVVVLDEFPINQLYRIVVRSYPEKDFLLSQLDEVDKNKYSSMIEVDSKKRFFFGLRAYLIKVMMNEQRILLTFNPGEKKEELKVYIEVTDELNRVYFFGPKKIYLSRMPEIELPEGIQGRYKLDVFLEDIHIYQGFYENYNEELPY